ncbi:MAG: acylglycerol kinase family protein [Bacteroidetes bacterium]|nr:acylglycerol kinase family protein [Bacteroidota bacterium]
MSSASKKILFIINPVSGVYKKDHIPEKIAKYIDQEKYHYTIRLTEYAGHAKLLSEQAVKEGFEVVVAVGGDGSINEVAQALVGTKLSSELSPAVQEMALALISRSPRAIPKGLLKY